MAWQGYARLGTARRGMDYDEIVAEHEERRAAKRYEPVERIPRWPRRRVQLECNCTCHMCPQINESEPGLTNASRETGAADG
jgi:hypothetical protein